MHALTLAIWLWLDMEEYKRVEVYARTADWLRN